MAAGFGPLFKTDMIEMFWCHRMMAWWLIVSCVNIQVAWWQVFLKLAGYSNPHIRQCHIKLPYRQAGGVVADFPKFAGDCNPHTRQ